MPPAAVAVEVALAAAKAVVVVCIDTRALDTARRCIAAARVNLRGR